MVKNINCIGMGVVSAVGSDIIQLEKSLRAGKSGVKRFEIIKNATEKNLFGGLVNIDIDINNGKLMSMSSKAMYEAISTSGISLDYIKGNTRVGFVYGTSLSEIDCIENYIINKESELISRFALDISYNLRKKLNIKGPSFTFSNACATGITAIEIAANLIKDDSVDICIVGCGDLLSEFILSGMKTLNILNRADKLEPFAKKEKGIILGEGSGFLILSNDKFGKKCTKISGYSVTNDAKNLCTPDIEAHELINAIEKSLEMANVIKEEIDVVFCSGNGCKYNDIMQEKAIIDVCSKNNALVTSAKPLIAHTLAASSIIECISAIIMMENDFIIPFCNDYVLDETADKINFSKEFINKEFNNSLLISTGFSGVNGALVLRKG